MRQYLIGSWNNADGYDYNGEQLMGNRNGASRRAHFNADGSAAVQSYGDPEPTKKPKISIADKILPQQRRLISLTNQMQELVADYKAGLYTVEEYSLLLDVITVKRDRCHELLMKARSVKPKRDEETEQPLSHTSARNAAVQPEFMQEKRENSVKKACTSAVKDCIILLTGSATLLMGLKFLF